MVGQLVMSLLADLVFGSAKAMRQSFDVEMDRYLEARGLRGAARSGQAPTR
jgi:hypothetical protein